MQDIRGAIRHFKKHQFYPALKSDLMATCNNHPELSNGDKKWIDINLPDAEYKTAEEVIKTMGWDQYREALYA